MYYNKGGLILAMQIYNLTLTINVPTQVMELLTVPEQIMTNVPAQCYRTETMQLDTSVTSLCSVFSHYHGRTSTKQMLERRYRSIRNQYKGSMFPWVEVFSNSDA